MSAPVIAFAADEPLNDRAKRLTGDLYRLRDQGSSAQSLDDSRRVIHEIWNTALRIRDHCEKRAVKAERALRALLARDDVPEEIRERCRSIVFGKGAAVHDARLLSDYEAAMIRQYRTMDVATRQAVRTLFDLAAKASEA
jgi:hypothetical protein